MTNRIILGSAQFGEDYGISNLNGKLNAIEVNKILEYSNSVGIDTIDTAISYKSSGNILSKFKLDAWNVCTKIPRVPENVDDIYSWLESQIEYSMKQIKIEKFSNLLFHEPTQLMEKKGNLIWESVQKLKIKMKIEKVGFSIYSTKELDRLLNSYTPEIVQVPYNILDQRIVTSGWLEELIKLKVEVHARSIFLQGLLLMTKNDRPKKFSKWSNIWNQWEKYLSSNNLSALQASLAFVLKNKKFDKIIIGVQSVKQLKEIIENTSCQIPSFPEFEVHDISLLDPSKWSQI